MGILFSACGGDSGGGGFATLTTDSTPADGECVEVKITLAEPATQKIEIFLWLSSAFYSDASCSTPRTTSPTVEAGGTEMTFYYEGQSGRTVSGTFVFVPSSSPSPQNILGEVVFSFSTP